VPTPKTAIVQAIFVKLRDANTGQLTRTVVTLADIGEAIREYNLAHSGESLVSDRNPANFWKDMTRRRRSANDAWPVAVFTAGFTGRQLTGQGRSFEFISLKSGQTEAFPEGVPLPTVDTPRHTIASAILPLASRRLGRNDEPWLIQVVVRLRVVETHLCLFSPRKDRIRQIDHLQNSVKLRNSEIDTIYLAVEEDAEGATTELIVTCEAKRRHEDITMDQLLRQPKAVLRSSGVTQNSVIPMTIKTVGSSQIHVVEFSEVTRDDAEATEDLTVVSEALYTLAPAVPGIGD
jgi:hypothetical protein